MRWWTAAHPEYVERQRARKKARQRSLAPPQLVGLIPAWLPLIWSPALVLERISELWLTVACLPRPMVIGRRTTVAREVVAYAEEAGVDVGARWRVSTVCPRCRWQAELLRQGPDGYWACRGCRDWEGTGKVGRFERVDVALGAYACGLRIGLSGAIRMTMLRRELVRIGARIARRPRREADIRRLLGIAALAGRRARWTPSLAGRWRWRRTGHAGMTPVLQVAPGPLQAAMAPHLIPAMIDSLLHPTAYLARFGA